MNASHDFLKKCQRCLHVFWVQLLVGMLHKRGQVAFLASGIASKRQIEASSQHAMMVLPSKETAVWRTCRESHM